MKTWLPLHVLALVVLVGCGKQGSDIRTGTLEVLVTESYLPLIQRQADEYHRIFSEVSVSVRGTTTREAVVDMLGGKIQCIVIDRPLNAEERQFVQSARLRVVETDVARDALAILVHTSNKVSSISLVNLESIITQKTTNWRQIPGSNFLGPIQLCLTGKNSGLYELLVQHFFKPESDVSLRSVATSQTEIIKYVAENPAALGIVSYAAWRDTSSGGEDKQKRSVKILGVLGQDQGSGGQAVELTQQNIYDGLYPLAYSLYIYTSEQQAGAGQGFSTFVADKTGQKIFLDAGLVPKKIPYRVIQLTQE